MTWRPTPPNPAVISDGFKEIGAAYKASVTDNDSSASPARTSGSITVDSDYKCIDLTNVSQEAMKYNDLIQRASKTRFSAFKYIAVSLFGDSGEIEDLTKNLKLY